MKRLTVVLATALALASPLQAQVLTFEGIGNQVPIGNYYNGGAGPNYGIEFFGSALASESGVGNCQGTGNFTGQPSGCGVLFFPTAPSTGMNRAAGFTGASRSSISPVSREDPSRCTMVWMARELFLRR